MNEFSVLCRILGSFYYRKPDDVLMQPLLLYISQGKLLTDWPLQQDELLLKLQKYCDVSHLRAEYQHLFGSEQPLVSPYAHDWPHGFQPSEIREFLQQAGMPLTDKLADHFGLLLLAASWIEDHCQLQPLILQQQLFMQYILPWCDPFLGKIEQQASGQFYRTLAVVTRGAVQAMADELQQADSSDQD